MSDLLHYRPQPRPRRKSVRLPATNHGARFQAEHPAPDGPWPIEPPPWWHRVAAYAMREETQQLVAKIALAVIVVSTVLMWVGCAHRVEPVQVARVQQQAIDCRLCEMHAGYDCEERGGPVSSKVVEYIDYRQPLWIQYTPTRCENKCADGNVMSHACRQQPDDWRVAGLR